jgi:hypothetical protein
MDQETGEWHLIITTLKSVNCIAGSDKITVHREQLRLTFIKNNVIFLQETSSPQSTVPLLSLTKPPSFINPISMKKYVKHTVK